MKNDMIKGMLQKILMVGLVMFGLFWAFSAQAQIRNTDVVLQIFPEYPTPNQNVEARLSTQVTDLNKAYIAWSVNGQRLSGGIGKVNFAFDTGSSGSQIQIEASIEISGGGSVLKSIFVTPLDLDILWEAVDSYAPPFYKGKTLVSKEGTFKIVALPSASGDKAVSSNLSYAWKKDSKAQPGSSGWGKRFFIFKNTYLDRANSISVTISDISGNVVSSKSMVATPFSPKIVFYKMDQVLGMLSNIALEDGFVVKKGGETIAGIPYFINGKDLESEDVGLNWTIGEDDIYTLPPRNMVSLVPESGKSGTTRVSLEAVNYKNLFPGITKTLIVNF